MSIGSASPEFFYLQLSSSGNNPIAAYESSTGVLVGSGDSSLPYSTTPANAGDSITLYATGLGATTPAIPAGVLASGPAPLDNPISISIGGVAVSASQILYAGAAPGYAGLYQINLVVPAGVPAGPQPVVISVGGADSPPGGNLYIAAGGCTLPRVDSFSAVPDLTSGPGAFTIYWSVDSADAVTFGPPMNALGSFSASGSASQTFAAGTTVALKAVNACGTSVASPERERQTPSGNGHSIIAG